MRKLNKRYPQLVLAWNAKLMLQILLHMVELIIDIECYNSLKPPFHNMEIIPLSRQHISKELTSLFLMELLDLEY